MRERQREREERQTDRQRGERENIKHEMHRSALSLCVSVGTDPPVETVAMLLI